jgi:UDP-N-acetylmuramoylalanine--D-glutamate ligase
MNGLSNRKIAVTGWDTYTRAAAVFLLKAGAQVHVILPAPIPSSQKETIPQGVGVIYLNSENYFPDDLDLIVHGPLTSRSSPIIQAALEREIEILSDLELASREFCCLSLGITGTNGKTTTAELISEMLGAAQRQTLRAGASGLPVFEVAGQSRDVDFLTLDLNCFQLDSIQHFRPAVAVVTNIRPDELDVYGSVGNYARSIGRIFQNQLPFDWAIIQSEALAHLRSLGVQIPSKIITFSAQNRRADLFLDRGLVISSLPNWNGPLFNMDQSRLRGPHNAENVMAALAAGRVIHLKLEEMISAVKSYRPGPHRLEWVAEWRGVKFINNSKATNVSAVRQSIEALDSVPGGEPNIFLIAGGVDKGLDYHDLGPLLAGRVKTAFLLGEAREKLRAAWSLFTPCALVDSLLEAVSKAAEIAVAGDVVLLSPACSSLDQFQSYQHRGESFRRAVQRLCRDQTEREKKTAALNHFP